MRERAKQFRKLLVETVATMDDDKVLEFPCFGEKLKIDTVYEVGNRVSYDGVLYKCIQGHVSQESWNPIDAVSLWSKILTSETEVLEWEQPSSTNPYMTGDKVIFGGKTYASIVDNNVWQPEVYGWELV